MAENKYKNEEYKSRIKGKRTIQYTAWSSMRQRCYDKKLHLKHPSYKNCYICEEWLDFQIFAKWFDQNYISGYQLDKDLLKYNNKLYSPSTCSFVPQEINLALLKPCTKRELPLGVYKHHYTPNKYVSHIKENKVSKYLGIFDSVEEAANCYEEAKKIQLINLANKYKNTINIKAYTALINYNIKN